MKAFFLFIQLFYSYHLLANDNLRSDSFQVEIRPNSFYVITPRQEVDQTSIIITNNSMEKQLGVIEDEEGQLQSFFTISDSKQHVIPISSLRSLKGLKLVPLSPPFQAVMLKGNSAPYEIPSTQKTSQNNSRSF